MLWCHEDQHQGPGVVLIRSDMFVITSWFLLLVKWRKLICSLQILSVSRTVIRIEAWTMMTPQPGTGCGWRVVSWSGYEDTDITTKLQCVDILHSWWWCHSGTVYIHHTSIYHHVSVLCPVMACCHCSLGLEDNCHVLLKLTWGPIHGRMGTPVANNFLLLLMLFHPNRNV